MPNTKKKILFLIFNLIKGGGAERVLVDQINNLDKNCFDCSICILNKSIDTDFFQSILVQDDKKKVIHFDSFFSITSWIRLVLWMRKNKFDIVYSHLFFANFVGRVAGKLSGVKCIIATEHNVYADRNYFYRLINRILSYFSYKIIAVSGSVKNYLVESEGINPAKIQIMYNGVDLNKYRYNPKERNSLRESFGLKEDDFVVLSIGQITLQKNYNLLIDIADETNQTMKENTYFFIAGWDEGLLGDMLKNRVNGLGLSDHVRFLGLRDDVPSLLSMTDVFLMTSKWEGFGLALVEAMANSKPVLVNKISTLEEIVGRNNQYGLIGRSAEELVSYLTKLKNDRMFYEKYANLSLQRSVDFSLEENLKQITKLFLEI